MNKKVTNHVTINGLLKSFNHTYKEKLVLNVMITALFANIDVNNETIKELDSLQGGDNKGIAEEKTDAKVVLANAILQNTSPASIFYYENGKKEKAVNNNFVYSTLERMGAGKLLKTGNTVVNDLTTDILFLKDSGVNADSILLISKALVTFDLDKTRPLEKIKSKKSITAQINDTDAINWKLVTNELKPAMKI